MPLDISGKVQFQFSHTYKYLPNYLCTYVPYIPMYIQSNWRILNVDIFQSISFCILLHLYQFIYSCIIFLFSFQIPIVLGLNALQQKCSNQPFSNSSTFLIKIVSNVGLIISALIILAATIWGKFCFPAHAYQLTSSPSCPSCRPVTSRQSSLLVIGDDDDFHNKHDDDDDDEYTIPTTR